MRAARPPALLPPAPAGPRVEHARATAAGPAAAGAVANARGRSTLQFMPVVRQPPDTPVAHATPAELSAAPAGRAASADAVAELGYPGDDAPRDELARWMAAEA